MTRRLEQAFAGISMLPEAEQEALAAWILAELASERQWQAAFTDSADALAQLADEALSGHDQRRTQPLNPDTLWS